MNNLMLFLDKCVGVPEEFCSEFLGDSQQQSFKDIPVLKYGQYIIPIIFFLYIIIRN